MKAALFAWRNIVVGLSWLPFTFACALVWVGAFPQAAFAYVDPSVMTYTIQALAGVAVALSAVLGVAARKTRKALMALLDVDENRHQHVEAPVYRLDDQGNPIIPEAAHDAALPCLDEGDAGQASSCESESAPASAAEKPGLNMRLRAFFQRLLARIPADKRPFHPSWKQRLPFAFAASALCFGTIFILSPLEIVGGSAGSLIFDLADVWWICLLPGLGLVAASTLIASVFPGRAHVLVCSIIGSLGLCAYIQCLCLNIGVPIANGDTIVWSDHAFMMAVCAVVWIAVICACVVLSQINLKRAQGVVALCAGCLVTVQTVGVLSLAINPPQDDKGELGDGLVASALVQKEAIATEEGLFTISAKNNVIVFVLDTFDTSTMKSILASNPEVLDDFNGFTCFTNVSGSMIPTHYAIPALLTGSLPQEGDVWSDYVSSRYERSTFLSDLAAAGYSIGLYSDSLGIGEIGSLEKQYDQVIGKTMNIHGVSSSTLSFKGTLGALWQMALYRELPWGMKWHFWYYTDQINKSMVNYNSAASPADTVYIMDDVRFFDQMQRQGINFDRDDAQTNGAFRFIHLLGAHYPYSYDAEANYVGIDQSNLKDQARGALYIVAQYLEQLKLQGVYDDATIIVTGDHGTWWLRNEPLTSASCPILFVKPAQSAEEAAQGAVVSTAPVSHADILPTIRASIGLDGASPYEGTTSVFDVAADDDERTRYYYTTSTETRRETAILEYAITGDAGKIADWSLTGKTWDPQE